MIFDPFESRHCRDIRNHLGQCFIKSIQAESTSLFQAEIRRHRTESTADHIDAYIRHRELCLKKVLGQMDALKLQPENLFKISILLWNLDLFFEFHEWLELKWAVARGESRKALQALVLSAVVYEQLAYNRKTPAKKVAEKACLLFKQHREMIPRVFDTDLFVAKLTGPDPVPPKFAIPQ